MNDDRRMLVLAAAAVLVTVAVAVLALWPGAIHGPTADDGAGEAPGQDSGTAGETASPATPAAASAAPFARELSAELTSEQRDAMESLIAEYAEPEQFDVDDGACVTCHLDAVPYEEGDDLEVVIGSMAQSHTTALGPEQTAEILAYFTGYQP